MLLCEELDAVADAGVVDLFAGERDRVRLLSLSLLLSLSRLRSELRSRRRSLLLSRLLFLSVRLSLLSLSRRPLLLLLLLLDCLGERDRDRCAELMLAE